MAQNLLPRPGWLDWGWALTALGQDGRLVGEQVRADEGVLATPYLLADEPVAVTVRAAGSDLAVAPPAAVVREYVTSRFHLDLDAPAVTAALERSALRGAGGDSTWVRRPAAAALWSYCLTYLCGGDPDSRAARQMFAELGRPVGDLQLPPEPGDLLTAGDHRLIGYGIAPHRVANVLTLARAFAARPDRYDERTLRELPAGQAVGRLAELPHIGPLRARAIASTALGHDDVLPDLARLDEQMRRGLGLSWSEVRASASGAAPYRSVLGDTLQQLLSE